MVNPTTLTSAASLLLLPAAMAQGIYGSSSPVLQVDARSYDSLIAKSNHTSIVEFYAPWCGHCKNLKPAYEKAAKSLTGLAKVAAVNCNEESNKPFCGSMGVQGFPTLKIVRPGKKPGRPTVEDYQGARSTKAIVDAVIDKIPNHVKRLKDADYAAWTAAEGPRAILFSDKGTVSALLKSIAIDFLGSIEVAQIRDKEKEAVGAYNIEKFPTLVLLPGEGKEPITYSGEMKKPAIVEFLSQITPPNPDPAPKTKKSKASSGDKKKAAKSASDFEKSSSSQASKQAQSDKASQTAETLEEDATASPNPQVNTDPAQKPIKVPDAPPSIPALLEGLSTQQKCLNDKAGTCVLALLPDPAESNTLAMVQVVRTLGDLHHKHSAGGKRKLFPFYQVPPGNSQGTALRTKLGLPADTVELVALNGKKGWYRHFQPAAGAATATDAFSALALEDWLDAIRMGDSPKKTLPEGLVLPAADLPPEPVKIQMTPEMEAMREELLKTMPEGMDLEIEEVTDEQYQRYMAQSGDFAGKDEGRKKDEAKIEHEEL